MIVKVQKPLMYIGESTVLIYNKSRTIEFQSHYKGKWESMFAIMKPALKLYFHAHLNKDNTVDVYGKPLKYDPGW